MNIITTVMNQIQNVSQTRTPQTQLAVGMTQLCSWFHSSPKRGTPEIYCSRRTLGEGKRKRERKQGIRRGKCERDRMRTRDIKRGVRRDE